ncbi:MAG: MFS transporter [Inquilinus limosus]|uniref:MFS transporter n=1 Tax=Inquilinus limosus TaxID=171674 RepID=A0A952FSF8_9PROT|nr:MFS transporter [Inquilinus limosus]
MDTATRAARQAPPALPSILTLTLCAFALTTAEFVIAGLLPEVAAGLSVSTSAAGHLVTAYALGMAAGGPVLTLLTAGLPRKPLATALLAIFIAGNLAAAAAPGYAVLLAGRAVSGSVVATFFAMAVVTAASLAPAGRQASAVAKVALGFNLAMILGAPIGTALGQQFGWRATFLAIAGLAAIALVLLVRLVPMHGAAAGSVAAELRVLRSRDLQLALALTALGNAGVLMVFTYLAPLLTQVAGFAAAAVPVLLLAYGLGATLGNLAGGWLSDRALLPSLIGLLAALAAVLALGIVAGGERIPAAALMVATGALAFAVIPGMQTRVLATAGAAPTLGIALNASGFQIAAATAAWLGGRVIDGPGLAALYPVGAVVTLLGAGLAYASWRRARRAGCAKV